MYVAGNAPSIEQDWTVGCEIGEGDVFPVLVVDQGSDEVRCLFTHHRMIRRVEFDDIEIQIHR
jgi:hypothetical protein